MRLLLIDHDPDFGRLLKSALAGSEFALEVAPDAFSGLRSLRLNPPNLALISADFPGENTEVLLKTLRSDPVGQRVAVVLTSELMRENSPTLQRLWKRFKISGFLARPFDLFNAVPTLQGLMELPVGIDEDEEDDPTHPTGAAAAPPPPARRTLQPRVLRTLVGVWLQKKSGVLYVDEGMPSRFSGGAPIDEVNAIRAVRAMSAEGNVRFDDRSVEDPPGDHKRFGQELWGAAREITAAHPEDYIPRVLQPVAQAGRLEGLGLHTDTTKVLRGADGYLPLGDLAQAFGAADGPLLDDVAALDILGLVRFSGGPSSPGLTRPSAPPPIRPSPGARPTPPAPPPPRAPLPPQARQSAVPAPAPAEVEALSRRLRKEVETLQKATPWVVLGIPFTDEPAVIKQAAARLRARYQIVADHPRFPPALRKDGKAMLEMVEEAERRALAGESQTNTRRVMNKEEAMFEQGVKAAREGDWKRAAQLFAAVHRTRIDDYKTLAWLGWCKIHLGVKPTDPEDDPAEDIRLAETFEPEDPDVLFFAAHIALREGRADSARERVQILRQRHPNYPGLGGFSVEVERAFRKG